MTLLSGSCPAREEPSKKVMGSRAIEEDARGVKTVVEFSNNSFHVPDDRDSDNKCNPSLLLLLDQILQYHSLAFLNNLLVPVRARLITVTHVDIFDGLV